MVSRPLAWAARVLLACWLALGMLGAARATSVEESERTPAEELSEGGEALAEHTDAARVARRRTWWSSPPGGRFVHLLVPQRTDPSTGPPPRPRWQRIRRTLPGDVDEHLTIS